MRSKAVTCVICGVCGILSSGCSFLFVTPPPPNASKLAPSEPVECTTSNAAPVIDTAVTVFQIVRTVYAVTSSKSDYSDAPISREVDIGAGASMAVLYGTSMVYGAMATSDCRDAKYAQARRRRRLVPEAAPVTSSTPPAYSPPAPASSPTTPATAVTPSPPPTESHATEAPTTDESVERPKGPNDSLLAPAE